MSSRAAGRDGGRARPFGLVPDGNLTGRLVDDGLNEEKRGNAAGPFLQEYLVGFLNGADAADQSSRPRAGTETVSSGWLPVS